MKLKDRKKVKIIAVLLACCFVLSIVAVYVTRSHWWLRDYSATVFTNGQRDYSAVVYKSPRGAYMVYADSATPRVEEPVLCYLVQNGNDDVMSAPGAHIQNVRFGDGLAFLFLPGVAYSKDENPICFSIWKMEVPPNLARSARGFEFNCLTGARVKVSI